MHAASSKINLFGFCLYVTATCRRAEKYMQYFVEVIARVHIFPQRRCVAKTNVICLMAHVRLIHRTSTKVTTREVHRKRYH